jgi:serine/threonine protein kinase
MSSLRTLTSLQDEYTEIEAFKGCNKIHQGYIAIQKNTNLNVFIKELPHWFTLFPQFYNEFLIEIKITELFEKHFPQHAIHLLDKFKVNIIIPPSHSPSPSYYLVFEYIEGFNLSAFDQYYDAGLTQTIILQQFVKFIKMFYHIHTDLHVLHCDLKTQNIMFDSSKKRFVLIDCESASKETQIDMTKQMTKYLRTYYDPLCLFQSRNYDQYSEMYGLGVTFAETLLQKIFLDDDMIFAYHDYRRTEDAHWKWIEKEYEWIKKKLKAVICPCDFDKTTFDLIIVSLIEMINPFQAWRRPTIDTLFLRICERGTKGEVEYFKFDDEGV